MSNTDMSIFDTFIAAKKALDELPAARAELAKLQIDLELERGMVSIADEEAAKAKAEIANLKAQLMAKEVELASATFRDKQSQETLDSLRGLLGIHVGSVSSDNAPMSEASVTEAQPSPVTEPVESGSQSEVGKLFVDSVPSTTVSANEKAIKANTADSTAGHYPEAVNDAQLNPTPQSPYAADSTAGDAGHYPEALPSDAESKPRSIPTPTNSPEIESKPYADRRYWQKPSNLIWSQWINGGGEKPHWMTSKEIDPDMLDF